MHVREVNNTFNIKPNFSPINYCLFKNNDKDKLPFLDHSDKRTWLAKFII